MRIHRSSSKHRLARCAPDCATPARFTPTSGRGRAPQRRQFRRGHSPLEISFLADDLSQSPRPRARAAGPDRWAHRTPQSDVTRFPAAAWAAAARLVSGAVRLASAVAGRLLAVRAEVAATSTDRHLLDLGPAAHTFLAAASVDEQGTVEVAQLPTIDTLKNWEPLKEAFPLVRGHFTVRRRVKDAHCLHTRIRPQDFNMSTTQSKRESGIRDRGHRTPPPSKIGTAPPTTQSRPPLLVFSWRPARAGGP